MTRENEKKMTIIGGTRGLGRWLAEHLKEKYDITITSRNKSTGTEIAQEIGVNYNCNNIEAIQDAKIIIFSVPIESMVKTIEEVAPYAPKGSVLMDVASIKSEVSDALEKFAPEDTEIVPSHPMFGPRVPNLKKQIIVLTPVQGRSNNWLPRIKEFLIENKCEIVETTPEEHDKYMSIVQGLTHFSFISLAATIKKLNINVKKSRNFSSPVYSLMLDMVGRIVYQNPYLYYSIQKNNHETENARQTLIDESIYISNLIKNEDEEDFVKIIVESAKHLNDEKESLKRSDLAINMINRKINLLKKSVGKEMGLKHHFTNEVYVGIISDVKSKSVALRTSEDNVIDLDISNVDILSDEDIQEWKKNNINLEYFDLSVLFPRKCDDEFLIKMFKNIEPVIDVEIIDRDDNQVNDSFSCFTFHYSLFDVKDKDYVEQYVESVGGSIL
ncbi:prephenate dehydrogenase [Methanosphaera sp. ISO3-F5]|uniref:prephenate dehydrogenase n=1 Tax=Methanosphaera sp. ISO3-F5 TaxID=1452353 RepID=UPI002B257BD0|nr:prephenate dehydrogenase [Methanosphaera sp. ISO3-F5]WQH63609.1 prephenate dehydrogenase [Methanosphaera sp. ISO3-F5]